MAKTRELLKMVLPFDYQTKTGPFYSYEWGIFRFQFVRNTNGSYFQTFCIQIPTVLTFLSDILVIARKMGTWVLFQMILNQKIFSQILSNLLNKT